MASVKLVTPCVKQLSEIYIIGCNYAGGRVVLTVTSFQVRGAADKSLARPTSRCRRTESIMSLERGVSSCAELQIFSCYRGWKEACHATRAISTTSRRELPSSFFSPPARQDAEGNSRHSDRNNGLRSVLSLVGSMLNKSRVWSL